MRGGELRGWQLVLRPVLIVGRPPPLGPAHDLQPPHREDEEAAVDAEPDHPLGEDGAAGYQEVHAVEGGCERERRLQRDKRSARANPGGPERAPPALVPLQLAELARVLPAPLDPRGQLGAAPEPVGRPRSSVRGAVRESGCGGPWAGKGSSPAEEGELGCISASSRLHLGHLSAISRQRRKASSTKWRW